MECFRNVSIVGLILLKRLHTFTGDHRIVLNLVGEVGVSRIGVPLCTPA